MSSRQAMLKPFQHEGFAPLRNRDSGELLRTGPACCSKQAILLHMLNHCVVHRRRT